MAIADTIKKVNSLEQYLNDYFVEKETEIRSILLSVISRSPMLLIGPPGIAKTMCVQSFAKCISETEYFYKLLQKDTKPDEPFGVIPMSAFKTDKYCRKYQGKVPTAHVVFIDEVFKSSSLLLNHFLSIMNEKIFDNDGEIVKCQWRGFFGASNELPDGKELGALYDRWIIRLISNGIVEQDNFVKMIKSGDFIAKEFVSLADIDSLIEESQKVKITDDMANLIYEIRYNMENEGLFASPRRFKSITKILRAIALLRGGDSVVKTDFEIIPNCLWEDEKSILQITKIVLKLSIPGLAKLVDIKDNVSDIERQAKELKDGETPQAVEIFNKIKDLKVELGNLKTTDNSIANSSIYKDVMKKIIKVGGSIGEKFFGMSRKNFEAQL